MEPFIASPNFGILTAETHFLDPSYIWIHVTVSVALVLSRTQMVNLNVSLCILDAVLWRSDLIVLPREVSSVYLFMFSHLTWTLMGVVGSTAGKPVKRQICRKWSRGDVSIWWLWKESGNQMSHWEKYFPAP